jgi:integrase
VRLIVLTGCRKMEALAAKWEEFDLEEGPWSKPSHHIKTQRVHHCALSADSCRLMRRMKREASGPLSVPWAAWRSGDPRRSVPLLGEDPAAGEGLKRV